MLFAAVDLVDGITSTSFVSTDEPPCGGFRLLFVFVCPFFCPDSFLAIVFLPLEFDSRITAVLYLQTTAVTYLLQNRTGQGSYIITYIIGKRARRRAG